MIPKLTINEDYIKSQWDTKKDIEHIMSRLDPLEEFTQIPAYPCSASHFAMCFDGHENVNPHLEDYGYAIDCKSIEKYVINTFGDNDPNEYLICIDLMSTEYEKPYKMGYFVDPDGNDTGNDYADYDGIDDLLENHLQFPGNFVTFTVYNLSTSK